MRAYFSCSFLPARFGFKVCTTCPSSLATPIGVAPMKLLTRLNTPNNFKCTPGIPSDFRGSYIIFKKQSTILLNDHQYYLQALCYIVIQPSPGKPQQ